MAYSLDELPSFQLQVITRFMYSRDTIKCPIHTYALHITFGTRLLDEIVV